MTPDRHSAGYRVDGAQDDVRESDASQQQRAAHVLGEPRTQTVSMAHHVGAAAPELHHGSDQKHEPDADQYERRRFPRWLEGMKRALEAMEDDDAEHRPGQTTMQTMLAARGGEVAESRGELQSEDEREKTAGGVRSDGDRLRWSAAAMGTDGDFIEDARDAERAGRQDGDQQHGRDVGSALHVPPDALRGPAPSYVPGNPA